MALRKKLSISGKCGIINVAVWFLVQILSLARMGGLQI